MFESHDSASLIELPEGLLELKAALEAEWPARQAELRASGVPLNDGEETAGGEPAPADGGAAAAVAEPLAGGAAAGAATDGGEPEDGEPTEPTEPAAAAAEPAFDPLETQAQLEYMQEQLAAHQPERAQLIEALQHLNGGARAGAAETGGIDVSQLVDEYGNLDPAALITAMRTAVQSEIGSFRDELRSSEEQREQAERIEQGHQRALDMIGDEVSRNGEFASTPEADRAARERVYQRANDLMEELVPRYGNTSRTAEIAIQRAAQLEREYIAAIRGEAVAAHTNRLGELAGAPGEPAAASAGAAVERPPVRPEDSIAERYARR